MNRRWGRLSGLIALVPLLACARDVPTPGSLAVRDGSDVEIVTVPASVLRDLPHSEAGDPILVLGTDDSTGALFSHVTGAQLTTEGGVVVASDANKRITWFGSDGAPTLGMGRLGQGPGEFQHLQLIGSDGARIVANDAIARRLTIVGDTTAAPTVVPFANYGQGRMIPVHLFADDRLLVRVSGPLPEPSQQGVVRAVDSVRLVARDGRLLADLGAHAADERVLRLRSNGGLTGGEPPYRRRLILAVRDSLVYVASTGPWEVRQYHVDGRLVRIVRIDRPRRRVSEAMRARYRAAVLEGVRDPYGIAEWTMLSADDVFPEMLPAFDAMLVGDDDTLWVRESVVLDDRDATWFGLDAAGKPVARLTLPAEFLPTHIVGGRAVGTYTRPDRLQEVRVYVMAASIQHATPAGQR